MILHGHETVAIVVAEIDNGNGAGHSNDDGYSRWQWQQLWHRVVVQMGAAAAVGSQGAAKQRRR